MAVLGMAAAMRVSGLAAESREGSTFSLFRSHSAENMFRSPSVIARSYGFVSLCTDSTSNPFLSIVEHLRNMPSENQGARRIGQMDTLGRNASKSTRSVMRSMASSARTDQRLRHQRLYLAFLKAILHNLFSDSIRLDLPGK